MSITAVYARNFFDYKNFKRHIVTTAMELYAGDVETIDDLKLSLAHDSHKVLLKRWGALALVQEPILAGLCAKLKKIVIPEDLSIRKNRYNAVCAFHREYDKVMDCMEMWFHETIGE